VLALHSVVCHTRPHHISKMYAASSNSSTASSTASSTGSATTSDHRAQPLTDSHNYGTQKTSVQSSNRQRSHKSTRSQYSQHTTSGSSNSGHHQSAPTLQSLVRTKCWSIAPLWKFVTYELETQPAQPTSKNNNKNHFSRSASVRGNNKKNKQSISYENNFYDMTSMSNGGHRRGPIWSKPHPHQSLNAKVSVSGGPPEPPPRQPLQRLNAISTLEQPCKVHHPVLTPNNSNASNGSTESSNSINMNSMNINSMNMNMGSETEWKPCGVLKKPGSYRSHAGLKKVAFLENTELNRSTL